MITLPAGLARLKGQKEASPFNLVELDLPAPLGSLMLSDRDIYLPRDYDTFSGPAFSGAAWGGPNLEIVQFRGLVADWPEEIDTRINREEQTADIGDLTLTLLNTGKDGEELPFSDYFLTVSPAGAEVRLYQTFATLPLSQREMIFKGRLSEPIRYDCQHCFFDVVASLDRGKTLGEKVDPATYPAASEEAIGQVMPLIYGQIEDFPCLAVGLGAVGLLREDFVYTDILLKVSDVSRFPNTGQVRLGSDTISYTGKDTANHNLTGVSGATADHVKGDVLWEQRSSYDYLVAVHSCLAIDEVRINGLLVPASLYSLDLTGPTLIKFNSHPLGQFLSEHLHEIGATSQGANTLIQYPTGVSGGGQSSWIDGNEDSGSTYSADAGVLFSNVDYGTIATIYYWVLHDGTKADQVRRNDSQGPLLGTLDTANPGAKRWQRFADSYAGLSWAEDLFLDPAPGGGAKIFEVNREVVYTGAIITSETGKQIPGLDFLRGAAVTCRAKGKKDDSAGTITGTPNALIERPDHVFKDVLINELGYSQADQDDASFGGAGQQFEARGYRFAGALTQQMTGREFLARLAIESRCWFFPNLAGQAKLLFRELSSASVRALARVDIVAGSLKLEQLPREELVNKIDVHYKRDWRQAGSQPIYSEKHGPGDELAYAGYLKAEDQGSLTSFGDMGRAYFLNFVRDPAMAQDLANFYLAKLRLPGITVEAETFLEHSDLERGDCLDLTFSPLGLFGHPLKIIKVVRLLGSARAGRMDRVRLMAQGARPGRPATFSTPGWAGPTFGA